jgi:hypothetical protein
MVWEVSGTSTGTVHDSFVHCTSAVRLAHAQHVTASADLHDSERGRVLGLVLVWFWFGLGLVSVWSRFWSWFGLGFGLNLVWFRSGFDLVLI